MSNEPDLGCATCGLSLASIGILYNGAKVVRILACENGHFLTVMRPEEHAAWISGAAIGRLYSKLMDGNLLPHDIQELMVRKGENWTRTKVPDVTIDTLSLRTVKPCPFCHSTNTSILKDSHSYFICCDDCNVYGPDAAVLTNAIDKWNSA